MKHLHLYIASKEVDLNEDSLVVMNYTSEELSNPTIVKNSYSQQITIPSTPSNDAIFGYIYRFDRSTLLSGGYLGVAFNPLARTPFEIRNNLGEIVESGYVKLDSIKRERGNITYAISLYGGLGSFFYSLSYNEEGNKLTLADLSYISDDGVDTELDFNINAQNVFNAWNTIYQTPIAGAYRDERWDVINFVPAYTGIPDDFDADKAVAQVTKSGVVINPSLKTSASDGSKVYSTIDGYCLVNLGRAHTAEDMKEFRSYLQRPAIKWRKIVEAVQRMANAKGFTFTLAPEFFNSNNPYYEKLWMLLPSMRSIDIQSEKKVGALLGNTFTWEKDKTVELTLSEPLPSGGSTSASGSLSLLATIDQMSHDTSRPILRFTKPNGVFNICCVVQIYAITSSGNKVGSDLFVFMDDNTTTSGETLVQNMGYKPVGSPEIVECRGYFKIVDSRRVWIGETPHFEITANNVNKYEMRVTWNTSEPKMYLSPRFAVEDGELYDEVPVREQMSVDGTYDFASFTGARTNTLFTKQSLLRSEHSPIDYLISYAKTFGLVFSYDKATNTVKLQPRNEWYSNGIDIDLSERIDYAQEIDITPNLIDSRYLEFKNETEGAFAKAEAEQSGRAYGSQRVNTGDDFSKETKQAIDNNAFKGAAQVSRRSKYNTIITQDGNFVPSVFIEADVKQVLYNNGESKEFAVATPTNTAVVKYNNTQYPTYDTVPRLQLHDAEDKTLDISNILVFYNGVDIPIPDAYAYYQITDDNDYMSVLNEGKPCWNLAGTSPGSKPIPKFGRYVFNGSTITHSLDFGVPERIDIPGITHNEGANVYSRFWRAFFADRYNADTRVVRAKVNLQGMQVGESLLRNFYFFEGCWWVMNKIINYSLTSDAPVECEFIRVQEKNNYKNGQNY